MTALANFTPHPQWVAWRNEERNGRPTKVPYVAAGTMAKADDPSGWLAHDDAARLVEEIANDAGGGIGIQLGSCGDLWLAGVDLDTCRDAQSGALEPWAEEVLQRLNSYTEVSPSGTGVKVYITIDPAEVGTLRKCMTTEHGRQFKKPGGGHHPPAIELHISNRYFAVTWQGLDDQPGELRRVGLDDLRWLLEEAGPRLAGKTKDEHATDGHDGGDDILSRLNRVAASDQRVATALRNAATMAGGSRSEGAFGLGGALKRAGWSFADMKAALLTCPATREWADEHAAEGDRQFQRIWERSDGEAARDKSGKAEKAPRKLTVLRPADCVGGDPRPYVVKGLVARGDLVIIAGQPGSGKSLLAPYLGYCVARGVTAFGRRVRPGNVLYFASEDGSGMRMRVSALLRRHGDAPNFLLIPEAIDLHSPSCPDLGQVEALIAEWKPALVIIDTVARSFPGLKENEPEDMGRVVSVSRSLAEICNSSVILLHHLPKAGSEPRGHSSLNGDADLTLIVEGKGNAARTVTMLKNRNGPSDTVLGFALHVETLGYDEDGDAITACILEEQDAPEGKAGPYLSPATRHAMTILADLLSAEGTPLPASGQFPIGLHGVREERWRAECESRRLSKSDKPESRAHTFRTVYRRLCDLAIVGTRDDWVWLTHPERVQT